MFTVYIKSGTSGHTSYDNNDLIVARIPSSNVPNKDDIITINDGEGGYEAYVVRSIERSYHVNKDAHDSEFREYICVYVIKN